MFDVGKLHGLLGRVIVAPLLLIGLTGADPLSAPQRAETAGNQSPAIIAGRDAIVNYTGLTPEQVQDLTRRPRQEPWVSSQTRSST